MPFQLHFFCFRFVQCIVSCVLGEGNRASRDYGLSTCHLGEGLRAVEDVLKPPGSLLATDRSKAVVLV